MVFHLVMGTVAMGVSATTVSAQVAPPSGAASSSDTPSIRIGVTIFGDYTYTKEPETTDADGNSINGSAFNIARSYINVTGNISRIVAFRVTPDVLRAGSDAGAALNGGLAFRIKYAYAQFNLDDWMPGAYARFGIQQTPWLDYVEGIYRYRFQGTLFAEREGYFASADAGASFRYNFPSNYGDIHVGVYNGENYNRAEVNDQKALMLRVAVRPLAQSPTIWSGLRAAFFYDADRYLKNAERNRLIGGLHFEHKFVNAGWEFLDAHDQTSITRPTVHSQGYSIFATPKSSKGWEALLRYDRLKPDTDVAGQIRSRTIVGVAYWFPVQGNVSTALLLDYDGQSFDNFTPALPKQQRVALHALVNF
jgi:hypothetical protein